MNIYTLASNIADAVADSSTISTWCTTNYSQEVSVYLGVDYRNPPANTDNPYCIIIPHAKTVGWDLPEKSHNIAIITSLYDESLNAAQDNDKITEYAGIGNSEAFRKLVEDEIAAMNLSGMSIRKIDIFHESLEEFPSFVITMMVTITYEWVLGEDPLD